MREACFSRRNLVTRDREEGRKRKEKADGKNGRKVKYDFEDSFLSIMLMNPPEELLFQSFIGLSWDQNSGHFTSDRLLQNKSRNIHTITVLLVQKVF